MQRHNSMNQFAQRSLKTRRNSGFCISELKLNLESPVVFRSAQGLMLIIIIFLSVQCQRYVTT